MDQTVKTLIELIDMLVFENLIVTVDTHTHTRTVRNGSIFIFTHYSMSI